MKTLKLKTGIAVRLLLKTQTDPKPKWVMEKYSAALNHLEPIENFDSVNAGQILNYR